MAKTSTSNKASNDPPCFTKLRTKL